MNKISSKSLVNTDQPPCALRFHPSVPHILLVGTYKYDESTLKKTGSIDIFTTHPYLKLLTSIPLETAVLDLQISPFDDDFVATAHSKGQIRFWRFNKEKTTLDPVSTHTILSPDALVTSLRFSDTYKDKLVATSTLFEVLALQINQGDVSVQNVYTHSLEAWVGAYGNYSLSNVIFSGGDDATFAGHDLRAGTTAFEAKTVHLAGVTSILPATQGNHHGGGSWGQSEFSVLTGGYDDCLCLSDIRAGLEGNLFPIPPKKVKEDNLGGGVWRLVPYDDKILVCCMYDGGKVVLSEGDVLAEMREGHNSMVYGGDVGVEDDGRELGLCSFYDNVVQVWK